MIHSSIALSQQNHSSLLLALNKVDNIKPKALIQERKQAIIKEIPDSFRQSVRPFSSLHLR